MWTKRPLSIKGKQWLGTTPKEALMLLISQLSTKCLKSTGSNNVCLEKTLPVFFIPNVLFNHCGGLKFLLGCNFNCNKLPIKLSDFHKQLRATWSCSVRVTTKWMTAFLWQLQTWRSYRALWLTPPSYRRPLHVTLDSERMRSLKAVNELGLEWSPPEEPSHSRLDVCFLAGRHQAPRQRSSPFFPEVHDELTIS